ncbi:MAG TPA: DedA family protein [Methylomirabilota bacterium]|nr:DedA family protein [Methylomirabilota bacterium]
MGSIEQFLEEFTYLGIFLVLFLAGLGVPIPEEIPVLASGVLAREGVVRWWLGLPVCILGVLAGDVALYWVGRHWGERVLAWRIVRYVLSQEREEALKAAYRKHGVKIVFTARHVMGLRAAAFLTAGIARVPFGRFLAVDAAASLLGVPVAFGLAFFFTDQLEQIVRDVHRLERWAVLILLVAVVVYFAARTYRRSRLLDPDTPARRGDAT